MNTTDIGKAAEASATDFLASHGFTVIARNFRTPRCEIDIIAKKAGCVHFVEVKYRSTARQGAGLDYVTQSKQRQMRYAAETWIQENGWTGEVTLSAIEVDRNFRVTGFIEDIS